MRIPGHPKPAHSHGDHLNSAVRGAAADLAGSALGLASPARQAAQVTQLITAVAATTGGAANRTSPGLLGQAE